MSELTERKREVTSPLTALVAGQGYVGFPLAMLSLHVGLRVVGVDTEARGIKRLGEGDSYVEDVMPTDLADALATERYRPTSDESDCDDFDVALITMPTPLREGAPDVSFAVAAGEMLGAYLWRGKCVVLESTTYPGTTEELLTPILQEQSALVAGEDFQLGYGPERIDAGHKTWGREHAEGRLGLYASSLQAVQSFYGNLVEHTVDASGTGEEGMVSGRHARVGSRSRDGGRLRRTIRARRDRERMTDTYEAPEPTLGSYLAVLRRRKWWVVAVTVLGLAASVGYSVTQPKVYSASAQLLLQPENAWVTANGSSQTLTSTDVLTELQLVTSAPVKAAVARHLGSVHNVSAAEVGQTNVISVTATAAKPARAALIANAYATAFITYQRLATITSLTAAETQLTTQIASITAQVTSLKSNPASAAEVVALLSQEAALKDQLAQLQVNGAVATGGIQVVTPATAPSAPSSPKPLRDAILGFLLGLLLGIGLAFVVEHLDDNIYLKDEVERLTPGARVLALVPMVGSWKNKKRAFVVTATEPNSVAGEAYRSLRTSLQFAALDSLARVILVTSPGEAEGKSSTVANLGVVLANAGERVAIVSCDLRRPRLGQFFALDERVGLTTVLLGRCSLEEALQPVPGIDGLSILATGERPSDPTGVLGSHHLAGLFDQLRTMFDLVIVDSPPVLPVTDAVILAQAVDATLLVVAAGQTRGKDLRRATESLSLVHANPIGVVLNEVTKSTGYGYGYGKHYGYGEYASTGTAIGLLSPSAAGTNGNGAQSAAASRAAHRRAGDEVGRRSAKT
jgi:receptor protein-tyrosine kinase